MTLTDYTLFWYYTWLCDDICGILWGFISNCRDLCIYLGDKNHFGLDLCRGPLSMPSVAVGSSRGIYAPLVWNHLWLFKSKNVENPVCINKNGSFFDPWDYILSKHRKFKERKASKYLLQEVTVASGLGSKK